MAYDDIYSVYLNQPNEHGEVKSRPAGRFMILDGKVHHLEDYHRVIGRLMPDGYLTGHGARRLNSLSRNPYVQIVPHSEWHENPHVGDIPEADLPPPPAPKAARPSVFEYHRAGMDRPHLVEVSGNTVLLDGNKLAPEEATSLMDNVQRGSATIKYKSTTHLAKMERAITKLRKAEDAPQPGGLVTTDPMTGLLNSYAYQRFIEQSPEGIYIVADVADFKLVNKQFGYEVGDEVIKVLAKLFAETAKESLGKGAVVFRSGGDDFTAFSKDSENVVLFVRHLRSKLEALPPVGGIYYPAMAIGLATDPADASKAMKKAKEMKQDPVIPGRRLYPEGEAPSTVYSMLPSTEAAAPMASEQPAPVTAPASEKPSEQ